MSEGNLPVPRKIDQSNASAGGDVVAGDKNQYTVFVESRPSVVDRLLAKLQHEMACNQHVRDTIEDLRRYYDRKSHDGIDGLEAKLSHAGREEETLDALAKKERFTKLLDKWSMFATAQEIFVYLLARAEHEFSQHILPELDQSSVLDINKRISARIVTPTVNDCGPSSLRINHDTALGMFYWLAEQCYVRWHK